MRIIDLKAGDFVRIRLFAKKPLIYKQIAPGGYELVAGDPTKRDRVWSSALVTGGIIDNDFANGVLRIGVVNQQAADRVYRAIIPYTSVSMLQVGVVEIPADLVPAYLSDQMQEPRIKYVRVKF